MMMQQAIAEGLFKEMHVHIAPVLLGQAPGCSSNRLTP
ncbi:hypothetical protein [Nocardia aurantiaca]|uniref:Uncharacterized protein n=1 Tax=Nocardia aurantiaca TaxID=2675850 RepID=A0A6I3L379_9NOCA|nr:hypothetical protein [Nocardia aurantiaca]